MTGFPNDLLTLSKEARTDLYKLALEIVLNNQTQNVRATEILSQMLDEMSIP